MYANHSMLPRGARPVSFGAALLVYGGIIGALVLSAPQFLAPKPPKILEVTNVRIPPPPEPEPEIRPKVETARPEPQIFTPTPLATQPVQPIFDTTPDIPDVGPPIDMGPPAGTAERNIERPVPLPPLIAAVQDPRFARDFQPEYPGAEIRTGREGNVSVRVLIGTDGRVKAVEQLRATSQAFFDATRRQALSKWRFKPASRGGVPQESWKTMNVRFELTGG